MVHGTWVEISNFIWKNSMFYCSKMKKKVKKSFVTVLFENILLEMQTLNLIWVRSLNASNSDCYQQKMNKESVPVHFLS